MGFANKALEGYYIKCGVPEIESKLISSLYGDDFINDQAAERFHGGGNKSKALAAAYVSEELFEAAGLYDDLHLWDQVRLLDEIERVVRIVRAAGVCSVCVHAYALESDITERSKKTYRDFLMIAREKASLIGAHLDTERYLREFSETVDKLNISSSAYGKKKGLFSKIFG